MSHVQENYTVGIKINGRVITELSLADGIDGISGTEKQLTDRVAK